ncbi:hypothetical protein [Desulfonatronum lacustre]|uniref:VgrG-related protein n=1 Tax=Desulfonatronum lacustre TaxID=66849 RepID=UPI0004B656CE|nr:hypothetical protein [Desulfonatronum lacustre]
MIVNQPWSPLLFPGQQHKPSPLSGQSPGSEQRQNADFLAEMLKMSLNASAIQSMGDLPQQLGGSSADPTAQLLSGTSPLTHMSRKAASTHAVPETATGKLTGILPESISKTVSEQIPETLQKTVLDSLAPMLNGTGAPGASGPDPLSQLIGHVTGSTQNPAASSLIGSPAALVALIQSAVVQPPSPPAPSPANPSTLRRAISAYTPQYSVDGLRQKIDHSTRRDLGPAHPGHATPTERLHAGRSGTADGGSSLQAATPFLEQKAAGPTEQSISQSQPGILAARFESASRPDAIGYDRLGGTCYGTYQLSSRTGGMDAFLKFLDSEAPQWAKRLREAGPANTKGRTGAMPAEWKRIHRENPERFAGLQHAFTQKTYYDPAANLINRRTGIDPNQASPALREVLWSTAVQHGVNGAANIFQRALDTVSANAPPRESDLIQAIYSERKTRFTGSTQAVRSAVQNRFEQEMQLALAMLTEERDVLV